MAALKEMTSSAWALQNPRRILLSTNKETHGFSKEARLREDVRLCHGAKKSKP